MSGPAGACPRLHPWLPASLLQHPRLKEGPGKGVLFRQRGGREGAAVQPKDWFQFRSLPRIYAAPVHVLLSARKGKRTAKFRLGAAHPRVRIRSSYRSAGPWRPRARQALLSRLWAEALLSDGNYMSRVRGAGSSGNAGRGRLPGCIRAGRRRRRLERLRRVPRADPGRGERGQPHTTSCLPW